jgi:hypothetical protein
MDGVPRQQEAPGAEAPEQTDGQFRTGGQFYQIRVKGHLNSRWNAWFEGLAISHQDDGTTLLTGAIVDQPALHGLIIKIRDLGLPLLSVVRMGKDGGSWSG